MFFPISPLQHWKCSHRLFSHSKKYVIKCYKNSQGMMGFTSSLNLDNDTHRRVISIDKNFTNVCYYWVQHTNCCSGIQRNIASFCASSKNDHIIWISKKYCTAVLVVIVIETLNADKTWCMMSKIIVRKDASARIFLHQTRKIESEMYPSIELQPIYNQNKNEHLLF